MLLCCGSRFSTAAMTMHLLTRVVFVFADPQLSLKLLLSFGTTLHSTL